MREVFIYYRVEPAQADALREAVSRWQAHWCLAHPGLIARLLVRDDGAGDLQTWMETYSTDPRRLPLGVDPDLQAAIERDAATLAPMISGARHSEAFVACA